jgi:signal transduction histidine kinase
VPPASLLTLVSLVTVFVGLTAAVLAWRERSEPGALPLAALLAGQCWWSVFFVFELQAATLAGKALWSNVQWVGVVVIPVAWLLFALEYTGRDRHLDRRLVAGLLVIPAITVALAATTAHHSLLYVDSRLVVERGLPVLHRTGGPWFWVITAYTYVLGLLGSLPILGLVRSDALPFRGQSVALLVGTLAPWASNVLFLVGGSPLPGLDPTPIAFAVSGVAYLGALTRFRLLGTSPSPNHRARRLVFERMRERAVVVDSHDYVVDMNESAAAALGCSRREALGEPAHGVLPAYDRLPADGSAPGHVRIVGADGERPYDVTVTAVTDSRGRTLGRVITFHDVTDHLRRQQRLEVLNRVLRHNIRNETNLIYGYADLVADDGAREAEIIKERALAIEEMGEKARAIVDVFERARTPGTPVPLPVLLGESVASVRADYPDVAIEVDPSPIPDVPVSPVLAPVFDNVIENAAEHNTDPAPHVWIDVEYDPDDVKYDPDDVKYDPDDVKYDPDDVKYDPDDGEDEVVRVVVADDGPTIDEYERSVLDRGTETPLEHGSGLGLWLITWGSEIAGGGVTFAENDPTGSIVTVEVPVLPSPDRSAAPPAASSTDTTRASESDPEPGAEVADESRRSAWR